MVGSDAWDSRADVQAIADALDLAPVRLDFNLDLMEMLLTDGIAGFAYVDLNFTFIRLNQILAGIYDMNAGDLIGHPVVDMVGDVNWDKVKPCLIAAAGGATVLGVHACEDRPDEKGVYHQRVSSFYPIRSNGVVVGIAAVVHDITERVMAERAVRDSEARYRLLAETIPNHVWIIDKDGQFQYANQRMLEYTGAEQSEIARTTWFSYVSPDERYTAEALWKTVRDAGVPFEIEYRPRRHDGVYRWFLVRGIPMGEAGVRTMAPLTNGARRESEKDGQARWLGTCTDIHDQKEAEQATIFIDDLSQRMRSTRQPDDIVAEVVNSLGQYLEVSRCGFAENDWENETLVVRQEYLAPGETGIAGTYSRSNVSPVVTDLLTKGIPVVISEREADERLAGHLDFYRKIRIRACIIVPIIRHGRFVASLSVVMSETSRAWHAEEISLVQTVADRTWLALENARLNREKQESDAKQRIFVRDMLAVVTDGRLLVCHSEDELPPALPPCSEVVDLNVEGAVRVIRKTANDVALSLGFSETRSSDLMTAVSEAAMNTLVHAREGRGWICSEPGLVQVWITDQGDGISMENLPNATLVRGYSTASTLGHGFKMIIGTIDRVHLLTGSFGTTIVIEQLVEPPPRVF